MKFELSEEAQSQIKLYSIPLTNPPIHTDEEYQEKPFILMRHGFSMQNLQEKQVAYENPGWTYDQVSGLQDMFTNENYLDSRLHEIGIYQCVSQQQNVNRFKYSTVFVSPLRRTIQTCIYLFASHPDRQNIKFVLLPQLAECLCSSGCFSPFTLTTLKDEIDELASKYQITIDHSKIRELGESWQIQVLEDEKIVKNILEKVECGQDECGNKIPYYKIILNEIKHTKNYLIETWPMLYKKAQKAKEILKKYYLEQKEQQINNGTYDPSLKIGVVSHGYLMKCITASRLEDDGTVLGNVLQNAEVYPYSFQ